MNLTFKIFLLSLSFGHAVIASDHQEIIKIPSVFVVAGTIAAVLVVHHIMSVPRHEVSRDPAKFGFGKSISENAYIVRDKGSYYKQIAESCTVS